MKESKKTRQTIAAIATAAVIALSVPVVASANLESGLKGKSVKVSYNDLNLEKAAGAMVLYRRLQQASREACGVEPLKIAGSVRVVTEMQQCYQETLTAAVEKINKAEITKIHES